MNMPISTAAVEKQLSIVNKWLSEDDFSPSRGNKLLFKDRLEQIQTLLAEGDMFSLFHRRLNRLLVATILVNVKLPEDAGKMASICRELTVLDFDRVRLTASGLMEDQIKFELDLC